MQNNYGVVGENEGHFRVYFFDGVARLEEGTARRALGTAQCKFLDLIRFSYVSDSTTSSFGIIPWAGRVTEYFVIRPLPSRIRIRRAHFKDAQHPFTVVCPLFYHKEAKGESYFYNDYFGRVTDPKQKVKGNCRDGDYVCTIVPSSSPQNGSGWEIDRLCMLPAVCLHEAGYGITCRFDGSDDLYIFSLREQQLYKLHWQLAICLESDSVGRLMTFYLNKENQVSRIEPAEDTLNIFMGGAKYKLSCQCSSDGSGSYHGAQYTDKYGNTVFADGAHKVKTGCHYMLRCRIEPTDDFSRAVWVADKVLSELAPESDVELTMEEARQRPQNLRVETTPSHNSNNISAPSPHYDSWSPRAAEVVPPPPGFEDRSPSMVHAEGSGSFYSQTAEHLAYKPRAAPDANRRDDRSGAFVEASRSTAPHHRSQPQSAGLAESQHRQLAALHEVISDRPQYDERSRPPRTSEETSFRMSNHAARFGSEADPLPLVRSQERPPSERRQPPPSQSVPTQSFSSTSCPPPPDLPRGCGPVSGASGSRQRQPSESLSRPPQNLRKPSVTSSTDNRTITSMNVARHQPLSAAYPAPPTNEFVEQRSRQHSTVSSETQPHVIQHGVRGTDPRIRHSSHSSSYSTLAPPGPPSQRQEARYHGAAEVVQHGVDTRRPINSKVSRHQDPQYIGRTMLSTNQQPAHLPDHRSMADPRIRAPGGESYASGPRTSESRTSQNMQPSQTAQYRQPYYVEERYSDQDFAVEPQIQFGGPSCRRIPETSTSYTEDVQLPNEPYPEDSPAGYAERDLAVRLKNVLHDPEVRALIQTHHSVHWKVLDAFVRHYSSS